MKKSNYPKTRKQKVVHTGECVDCKQNYQWRNKDKIRCDNCQKVHTKINMQIIHKNRYNSDEEFREKMLTYNDNWRRNNREKVNAKDRERRKYPEVKIKLRARELARSVPFGEECGICKSKENLQKHHWRYDKPFLVSTMCSYCHTVQHIKNKPMEIIV